MATTFMTPNERSQNYLLAHQPSEHAMLKRLREVTAAHLEARMQISPEQGHLLALPVRLIGARRVLEVGTFTGYSALAMALALPADGRLVACDISEDWTALGQPFWQAAGVADKIELKLGAAADTLAAMVCSGMEDSFELAFIDADKTGYTEYYRLALRLVRPGGLIVLDNILRSGRVADPGNNEPDTVALRAMNSAIRDDERVDRVLLPIADGMTIVRRR